MKINFLPQFLRQVHSGAAPGLGGGGGGLGGLLGGSTPFGAIAQGAVGLAQTIGGWVQQRKATKQLERLQSPTYTQNKSIMDYYSKALQRYNVNPYQSAQYQTAERNAGRVTASGLSSLQDRRSAIGGISRLVGLQNDALLKAGVNAEAEQNQRFGVLGGATQMQAGEDRMAFDINKTQPFERKYNLLAAKAGGGNQIMNAGIHNLYGGFSSANQYDMIKKLYGG